nr:MAG TPA: hypothetical protein [Caudoviricetes sp.]
MNLGPPDYESVALTTELQVQITVSCCVLRQPLETVKTSVTITKYKALQLVILYRLELLCRPLT